jgi:hypothetical protein
MAFDVVGAAQPASRSTNPARKLDTISSREKNPGQVSGVLGRMRESEFAFAISLT